MIFHYIPLHFENDFISLLEIWNVVKAGEHHPSPRFPSSRPSFCTLIFILKPSLNLGGSCCQHLHHFSAIFGATEPCLAYFHLFSISKKSTEVPRVLETALVCQFTMRWKPQPRAPAKHVFCGLWRSCCQIHHRTSVLMRSLYSFRLWNLHQKSWHGRHDRHDWHDWHDGCCRSQFHVWSVPTPPAGIPPARDSPEMLCTQYNDCIMFGYLGSRERFQSFKPRSNPNGKLASSATVPKAIPNTRRPIEPAKAPFACFSSFASFSSFSFFAFFAAFFSLFFFLFSASFFLRFSSSYLPFCIRAHGIHARIDRRCMTWTKIK